MRKLIREGRALSGRERNCCFLNTHHPQFADISAASGLDVSDDGRGVAVVDWDLDGDLDLWINNRSGPQVRFFRNDVATANHYLAVRLEGRTSNRDAIGARVEVHLTDHANRNLITTLRAGNGFLAQSSKWVHFGLGPAKKIDRLVVQWPGGDSQIFTGLQVDRRYRLIQGQGEADPWTKPDRVISLEPSLIETPPPSDAARIVMALPIPLPRLTYEDSQGQQTSIHELSGQPILITLWATWCSPCIGELKVFVAQEQQLREAGLEIVALSVDGVDDDDTYGPQDARELLAQLNFPFLSGFASERLLDILQLVHNSVIDRHDRLGVPTSILIDAAGHLSAIYKGPVEVEQLLSDLKIFSLETNPLLDSQTLRLASLPFMGRRLGRGGAKIAPLANSMARAGFLEECLDYVRRHQTPLREEAGFPHLMIVVSRALYAHGAIEESERQLRHGLGVEPEHAALHNNLGLVLCATDRVEEGIGHYRKAVSINPGYAIAHYNLGNALLAWGNREGAIKHFRKALQVDTEYHEAHTNLAVALRRQGELDEALEQFQLALTINADNPQTHYNLANLLVQQKKIDEAIVHYREALRVQPEHIKAHLQLAGLLWRQGDLDRAVNHYAQVLQTQPDHALAHRLMGEARIWQREFERAVTHFRKALQHGDKQPETYYGLGIALAMTGPADEAITAVRQAMRLAPNAAEPLNMLARILSTSTDPKIRNPKEAVKLAERAAQLTGYGKPKILDTLAAAYASASQFEQAVATAQKAVDLALADNDQALAEKIEERKHLYQQRKPYRQRARESDSSGETNSN